MVAKTPSENLADIDGTITSNGSGEITGATLRSLLRQIVESYAADIAEVEAMIPTGGPYAITDANASANTMQENSPVDTLVGITAVAFDAPGGDSVTYSLEDDAGNRFKINAATGVVQAALATIKRPCGPLTVSYLPWDLYDGGACPVVGTQTNTYWVDPTLGSDANNGLTVDTPWKHLQGRTISDAVVYVKQPASGNTHDLTGTMDTAECWLQGCTLDNVTIRAVGETDIYIANNVDVDGNQDGAMIYLTSTGGAAQDVTFYRIKSDGWGQGVYCEYNVDKIRFLRCGGKNPTLDAPSGSPTNGNAHIFYVGYNSGAGTPGQFEIAYCEGINERTFRAGAFLQCYGTGAGVQSICAHHNLVKGGNWNWAIIHDREGTTDADYFNNTFSADFSVACIEFSNYSSGTVNDSDTKVYNNILANSGSGRKIISILGTHTPDLGANNTCYASAGAAVFSGTTLAAVGQERNPGLDSSGIASNVLERASGALLTATPVHLGYDGKAMSSTVNADRGAYHYGPVPASATAWTITVAAESDDATYTSADFNIELTEA